MLICLHHLDPRVLDYGRAQLAAAGRPVIELAPAAGDPLPDLAGVEGIVVLGGAQSVVTIDDDPLLSAEADWLARAVAAGIPVLGICLGAQLLAHVLGAAVYRLPRRALAWVPLRRTEAGAADPVLGRISPTAHGLHWNEDGFDLPAGAVELLAPGPAANCLAFRFGDRAWGVQFHPEIAAPSLDHWYASWEAALVAAGVSEDDARREDSRHLGGQPALAEAIFSGFAARLATTPACGAA